METDTQCSNNFVIFLFIPPIHTFYSDFCLLILIRLFTLHSSFLQSCFNSGFLRMYISSFINLVLSFLLFALLCFSLAAADALHQTNKEQSKSNFHSSEDNTMFALRLPLNVVSGIVYLSGTSLCKPEESDSRPTLRKDSNSNLIISFRVCHNKCSRGHQRLTAESQILMIECSLPDCFLFSFLSSRIK